MSTTASPIYLVSTHAWSASGNDSSAWGFYHTLAEAESAVADDLGSMSDCLYTHLVIERVEPGIIAHPEVVQWYEWISPCTFGYETDHWAACPPPLWAEHMSGFGIG